jgi:Ca2+-binding RTX toxin-like protein
VGNRSRIALFVVCTVLLVSIGAIVTSAGAGAQCFGKAATKTVSASTGGTVNGTPQADVIVGSVGRSGGAVKVNAKGGNDRVCVNSPGRALKIFGQDGNDQLRGNRAQLFGGDGADTIIDWVGSGFAKGGPGADRLFGRGGSGDFLYGNGGDDHIDVGAHGGYAYGGPGNDTCVGSPLSASQSCEN